MGANAVVKTSTYCRCVHNKRAAMVTAVKGLNKFMTFIMPFAISESRFSNCIRVQPNTDPVSAKSCIEVSWSISDTIWAEMMAGVSC